MTRSPLRAMIAMAGCAAVLSTAAAFAQNIAIVNNKPIPKARADAIISQLATQGQANSPELQKAVREELINREILMQEADKRGLLGNADVQAQIERSRQQVLIGALAQDYFRANPPSDAEIKAQYENLAKSSVGKEYNARHILVEREADARGIILKLKSGAKFEELAVQSKDPGSGENGGSLGWARATTYVPPFAEALTKLTKGRFTDTPFKSQFGYHVIRLDDVRDAAMPSIAQARPQIIESIMQNQQWQQVKFRAMIEDFRSKAKVE